MVGVVVLGTAMHVAVMPVVAQDASPAASTPCPTTTESENEALIRRFYEEAWNQGDVAIVDEIWPEPPAVEAPVTQYVTRDDVKARTLAFRTAFPDLHINVPRIVTEGDVVVVRSEWTGTHQGEFDGISATGRTASWTGIEMYRIACGQIVAAWVEVDALDLRGDLGIITEDELGTVASPEATPEP